MITKKQKFRTGVGCIYWLLVATWSFSLQLLQNHPADENRRRKRVESTQWLQIDSFFFTWISSFLFLFPRALGPEMLFRIICQGSRRQTAVESPSFFCSSSFNNLALRLFPFPDISAGPIVLPSLEQKGGRERGATMMMTIHLPSTFVLLLCCEIEERISILQLVAHVYLCICDRSSWNGIFFLGEKKWDL